MTTPTRQQPRTRSPRPVPAKLIFNPVAGSPAESDSQLAEVLSSLQSQGIAADVHLVRPESRLSVVARNALRRGTRLIVVSGGDGTVESVLDALVGTPATLGIVPTGTRNNVALGLGIPANEPAAAVDLLRAGRRLKIDVGHAQTRTARRWFLEFCGVGLAPALYPAADELQRGQITRLGDLLSTLVSHTPSDIRLSIDDDRVKVDATAHLVLAANMPYMGYNFRVAPDISFLDGRLELLVYSDLTKLDLISYAVQLTSGAAEDSRIDRYRIRRALIRADPEMPVMADGFPIGTSPVKVTIRRSGLNVMAGKVLEPPPASPPAPESEPPR